MKENEKLIKEIIEEAIKILASRYHQVSNSFVDFLNKNNLDVYANYEPISCDIFNTLILEKDSHWYYDYEENGGIPRKRFFKLNRDTKMFLIMQAIESLQAKEEYKKDMRYTEKRE